MTNSLPWKITMFLIGKPIINGPFSMAMLNNQMVCIYIWRFPKMGVPPNHPKLDNQQF